MYFASAFDGIERWGWDVEWEWEWDCEYLCYLSCWALEVSLYGVWGVEDGYL